MAFFAFAALALLLILRGVMTVTYTGRQLDLDAFTALDAGTWEVGLYTNNFTPNPGMDITDLTTPSYTGYALQPTGGWGGSYINGSGYAQTDAPAGLVFQPTGSSGLPVTIYGWYLQNATPKILAAELLPSPVTFSTTSSSLTLFPSLKVGTLV